MNNLLSTDLDSFYNQNVSDEISEFDTDEYVKYHDDILDDIIDEYGEYDEYDLGKLNNLLDSDDKIEVIKKKKIFCDACNNDNIIEATAQGILVCRDCGQVIANLMDSGAEWSQFNDDVKKDLNRCSHPISQLLPQSSAATTIAGGYSSRIKTLHGWSAMPYKERSLNEVFKIIQQKCHEGKILKCIEDDAKIMYKNINECKHPSGKNKGKAIIIRGKNRMSVIAGCILNACKKKDKTRSPKEIAELFGLKYTEITKGCKIFQKLAKLKKIELNLHFTKPEHFITRFCEELKIKSDYTQQAIQIANNVQKLQLASVHTPLSLATGAIYLMIQLNNLAILKKTIAEKFNVSQVTIAKAFKKLEPFINILTNDKICDKLCIEIKKYQDIIEITPILKPKFIRFNIDTSSLKISKTDLYSILKLPLNKNSIMLYDEQMVLDHTIEIFNQNKQIENNYLQLKLNFTEMIYDILSFGPLMMSNCQNAKIIENTNLIKILPKQKIIKKNILQNNIIDGNNNKISAYNETKNTREQFNNCDNLNSDKYNNKIIIQKENSNELIIKKCF